VVLRCTRFAQLRAGLSSVAAAAFRAASSQASAFRGWWFWGSRLLKPCARRGSRCRPSKLRRNRLTSHSSGRLRRRLIPALVGSSCGFFVWCVSPSFALACRPSPQQFFAQHRRKPGHSELVVLGQWVAHASRSSASCCRLSMLRRNRLTSHSSGRLRRHLIPALGLTNHPHVIRPPQRKSSWKNATKSSSAPPTPT
jgi:hypothetical protein